MREPAPGTTTATAFAIPRATGATSVPEGRAWNHPATRSSRGAHCSRSTVFPYPEPAMSIRIRADD